MYHLKDLDASRLSYSSFSETHVFFKHANSAEKPLLNYRNASLSHCFRNSSLTIIWNKFSLSKHKRKKGILNLEKKTYLKKHFINVQQNILLRKMERLKNAKNALENEDSLLNKELNNSFLNHKRVFFFEIQNSVSYVCN